LFNGRTDEKSRENEKKRSLRKEVLTRGEGWTKLRFSKVRGDGRRRRKKDRHDRARGRKGGKGFD